MENYTAAARKAELRKWAARGRVDLNEARRSRFSLLITKFSVIVVEAMIGEVTLATILLLAQFTLLPFLNHQEHSFFVRSAMHIPNFNAQRNYCQIRLDQMVVHRRDTLQRKSANIFTVNQLTRLVMPRDGSDFAVLVHRYRLDVKF